MCSLAPSAPLGLDTTAAFLDRRRGVAAVAPATCGVVARKPALRAGAAACSSAPTKKRSRDGFDGEIGEREGLTAGMVSASAIPAPSQGQQRLQERMRTELDAIRVLHRKAMLLCRDARRCAAAAPGAKGGALFSAAGLRRKVPLEAAAKRCKTTPSNPAPEAKKQSTEAVKQSKEAAKQQQHRRPMERATPTTTTKTSALKQSTEPVKQKQQQRRPVQQRAMPAPTKGSVARPVDKAQDNEKKRRLEIAVAREKCRQELLEMERTALPDETIYPWDLEELGIAFQYAVTRTWKQAHGPAI